MLALIARLARVFGPRSSVQSSDPATACDKQSGHPLELDVERVDRVAAPTSADPIPTRISTEGPHTNSLSGGRRPHADTAQAAADFLTWIFANGLDNRIWTVDEIWYLAAQDFAMANDIALPPRNLFLAALKRRQGVRCQYDKRVRVGSKSVKTTIYAFSRIADLGTVQAHAPAGRPRAAA